MPYKLIPPGKRGNASYVVRGTISGQRVEVSTGFGPGKKPEAEIWATEFAAKLQGQRVPGQGEVVPFPRAAELYKAATPHLSKVDIRQVDAVAKYFKDSMCHEVAHADLVAAADELKPGRAPATKNRKVIVPGAAVLHYAAGNKWCTYERIKKFKVSTKSNREPAKNEDVALLIANVEKQPSGKATGRKADHNLLAKRVLLFMLYELGLRLSHMLSIRWDHVDLQAARVRVRIPKSDEIASLEMSAQLVAELANLQAQPHRPAMGRVVTNRVGRVFPWATNSGVYHWLTPLTDRLGVTYTPHMSRHKLATDAGDANYPDKKAAELGVWKDSRSLHRYQHVKPDAIPGRTAATLLQLPTAKKVG